MKNGKIVFFLFYCRICNLCMVKNNLIYSYNILHNNIRKMRTLYISPSVLKKEIRMIRLFPRFSQCRKHSYELGYIHIHSKVFSILIDRGDAYYRG